MPATSAPPSGRFPRTLVLWMLLGVLAAGCGEAQDGSRRPAGAPPGTARAEAPPRDTATPPGRDSAAVAAPDTAAWTAGITETEAPPGLRSATLRAVRTGQHDGFDRVVFAFDGEALPGYHLEYIDEPVRQCGSGRAVPLGGDGWLEVRLAPAQAHTEDGTPTVHERATDLSVLQALKLTCDFEGVVTWVLGLSTTPRYRVQRLRDPLRLVVDVRH